MTRQSTRFRVGVALLALCTQVTYAALPAKVPGEFDFPGNFNPMVFDNAAQAASVSTRDTYVTTLKGTVNGDAKLSATEKAERIKRIDHSRADYDTRYVRWQKEYAEHGNHAEFSCDQAQYTKAKNVFNEAFYLAEQALAQLRTLKANPALIEKDML